MLPYAAYLRVYEPLSAFEEPELSRWVAYAASPHRPRRREALGAEYGEALRRVTALPPIVVPEQESEHAYIRWAEGVIYVCPWQTRLRSWLALGPRDDPSGGQPATASAVRTLIYATAMAQARRRLARSLTAVRKGLRGPLGTDEDVRKRSLGVTAELEDVGRWLEDFHPRSVVELDYGGLVNLLTDDALRSDQSVAEIRAAISGLNRDEPELAITMYRRASDRWRPLRAAESAN